MFGIEISEKSLLTRECFYSSKCAKKVESLEAALENTARRLKEIWQLWEVKTSSVTPVEPLKKFQSGLKFDDLGFPIPPTNTGTSADGGRKKEKNGARNTIRTRFVTGANHTEGRFFNHGYDHRMRKIKIPLFDGDDAHGCNYKAERYFEVIEVDPREQLRAAVLCMEGQALSWFRWSEAREPFRSYGSARENVNLFEQLAGQLRGVLIEVMKGTFIKCLKPDLRSSVRVMQPVSLGQAMKLSIVIDENKTIGGSVTVLPVPSAEGNQTALANGTCLPCEDVEALENVVEDEPHFFTKIVDNDLCAGKGGRGGSMVGSGGGWLAKHSIVSNEGCGGAVLAVLGGKSSNGACGGEVNSRGVILGVFKSLLGEILGDVIGERGGYTIRVDGGTIWMEPTFNNEGNRHCRKHFVLAFGSISSRPSLRRLKGPRLRGLVRISAMLSLKETFSIEIDIVTKGVMMDFYMFGS
ncbi:hypothetical protein Tco_0285666 [Tanacetum coccineum]